MPQQAKSSIFEKVATAHPERAQALQARCDNHQDEPVESGSKAAQEYLARLRKYTNQIVEATNGLPDSKEVHAILDAVWMIDITNENILLALHDERGNG